MRKDWKVGDTVYFVESRTKNTHLEGGVSVVIRAVHDHGKITQGTAHRYSIDALRPDNNHLNVFSCWWFDPSMPEEFEDIPAYADSIGEAYDYGSR